MWYFYLAWSVLGGLLVFWASIINPAGMNASPDDPMYGPKVTTGPYALFNHPMYVGEWMAITGLAGMAGGLYNFFAIGLVTELLLRDWARRESNNG